MRTGATGIVLVMTEHPTSADNPHPQPTETPARKPSRTRRWLSGTALVAAGVVAGSGATYAVSVHSVTPTEQQASGMGRPGGPGGGFGGPTPP